MGQCTCSRETALTAPQVPNPKKHRRQVTSMSVVSDVPTFSDTQSARGDSPACCAWDVDDAEVVLCLVPEAEFGGASADEMTDVIIDVLTNDARHPPPAAVHLFAPRPTEHSSFGSSNNWLPHETIVAPQGPTLADTLNAA
jgi:hypothetical protein